MVAKLVEDLVHLEGGEDRLDQHRRLEPAVLETEPALGEAEDVVPEPRLEVRLQLGEVEVAAVPRVVAQRVEPEVEERSRDGRAVDLEVALDEVPTARTDEQDRHPVVQPVLLLARVE